MSLTKDKLEQFVKQGKAYEKLLQSTESKNNNNPILLKQLKQTKKLLKKIK
ncbi:hypothetical protein [Desulfitibacter alkalitolerans]|uniref:hypothetical protein n=1 Tax=Desulfitibacter alkalitolerans TaxID=264641 RepID=UPI0012EBB1E7|nr:hypothetical protein [Desulfitibacter alkalitolerans]